MKCKLFLSFTSLFIFSMSFSQLTPVGQWREHMEYRSGLRVTVSPEKIYVASKFGAYSVSKAEGEIERLNKVTGLHDAGIRSIKYNSSNNKLLIAYNNSNLDVVYRNDIINIPDILRRKVCGDKNIYDISVVNDIAYLISELIGTVDDLSQYEIIIT